MSVNETLTARSDIDFLDIARRIISAKWLILTLGGIGLACGILYLHLTPPTYTARIKVTPAASSGGGTKNLGGFGGLAELAGVSLGGQAAGATPFDLYMDRIKSRVIADELSKIPRIMTTVFADQWDTTGSRWREPDTALRRVKESLKSAFGFPVIPWHPPAGDSLAEYLSKNLVVIKPGAKDAPITTISFDHQDPEFAQYLLREINRVTDRNVRTESLDRSMKYAAYLSTKLRTVALADHRVALSEALRQQEEAIMMASSGVPYAALTVQAPISSEKPTNPKPITVLIASLLGGLAIGVVFALANLKEIRRRLVR